MSTEIPCELGMSPISKQVIDLVVNNIIEQCASGVNEPSENEAAIAMDSVVIISDDEPRDVSLALHPMTQDAQAQPHTCSITASDSTCLDTARAEETSSAQTGFRPLTPSIATNTPPTARRPSPTSLSPRPRVTNTFVSACDPPPIAPTSSNGPNMGATIADATDHSPNHNKIPETNNLTNPLANVSSELPVGASAATTATQCTPPPEHCAQSQATASYLPLANAPYLAYAATRARERVDVFQRRHGSVPANYAEIRDKYVVKATDLPTATLTDERSPSAVPVKPQSIVFDPWIDPVDDMPFLPRHRQPQPHGTQPRDTQPRSTSLVLGCCRRLPPGLLLWGCSRRDAAQERADALIRYYIITFRNICRHVK